ncbi:MAG: YceD family protein [Holophagaceae bacterium]|nr:YceD family protein [Holophagaceae bacterium]
MIELSKLAAEGLRLEGALGHVQVEANEALRNLRWQVFVQPSDLDFFIDIKAEAVFEGSCGRCLEPVDKETAIRAQFLGSSDSDLVARGSHTLGTQDLDVVYLPEEVLDEEALVREQFILQRPMQLLCRDDCQGLCPQCGKNWNKGRCQCSPDCNKSPSALAVALADIKLDAGH